MRKILVIENKTALKNTRKEEQNEPNTHILYFFTCSVLTFAYHKGEYENCGLQ